MIEKAEARRADAVGASSLLGDRPMIDLADRRLQGRFIAIEVAKLSGCVVANVRTVTNVRAVAMSGLWQTIAL